MPFYFPPDVDTPENRRAWSQHQPCNRVIEVVRKKPGASSTLISQLTGFRLKEARTILWFLIRKDPRQLVVRRRSVSAYFINRKPRPRRPRPAPVITDPRKLPIFDRRKAVLR